MDDATTQDLKNALAATTAALEEQRATTKRCLQTVAELDKALRAARVMLDEYKAHMAGAGEREAALNARITELLAAEREALRDAPEMRGARDALQSIAKTFAANHSKE